jgi:hypothetical protein
VLHLAGYGRIRIAADRLGVETIDREGQSVVIRFRPTAPLDPVRLVNVVSTVPGAVLVPPVSLKLDLSAPLEVPAGPVARPAARTRPGRGARAGGSAAAPSWWTARATTGSVEPGFTRDDVLRRPDEDPLAAGGVFERLEGLLRALS